uniref:Uncharacterized protein n=1 Tax=Salix viminalis TaxID=40686 RepID=A0A6N2K7A4_SALVM
MQRSQKVTNGGLSAPGAVALNRLEPNVGAGVEPNAGVDEKLAPNTGASPPDIAGVEPNAGVDEKLNAGVDIAGVEPNAGVDEKLAVPHTGASPPDIAAAEPNPVVDEVVAAPCAVPNRNLGGTQLR